MFHATTEFKKKTSFLQGPRGHEAFIAMAGLEYVLETITPIQEISWPSITELAMFLSGFDPVPAQD